MPNHALIVLTGHIGKVEELKYLPKGDAVLRLSLCVNTGWGDKKTASWYDCTLFGQRAEKLQPMLSKGAPITVIGEPSIRKWESNGKAGTSVSVRVQYIVLLGGREERQQRDTIADQDLPSEGLHPDDGNVPF